MFPPFPTNPPPPLTTDGTRLPENWRSLPARWVLDPTHPNHCEACLKYAREYKSYDRMMGELDGAFPRYFPGCRARGFPNSIVVEPGELEACGDECRCWIEVKVDDVWTRVRLHT